MPHRSLGNLTETCLSAASAHRSRSNHLLAEQVDSDLQKHPLPREGAGGHALPPQPPTPVSLMSRLCMGDPSGVAYGWATLQGSGGHTLPQSGPGARFASRVMKDTDLEKL